MLFFLMHVAVAETASSVPRKLVHGRAGAGERAASASPGRAARTVKRPPLRRRDRLVFAAASTLLSRGALGCVSCDAADAASLAP
jgi:hypothetical protein